MAIPFSVPDQLPFLQAICWQIKDVHGLTLQEILKCYERGWHYRRVLGDVGPEEQAFIQTLAQHYGSWLNSMAQRLQHQKILDILDQLSSEFLNQCRSYFGGETLLTLVYDEYRLSQDIDFLCSDAQGYRQLRRAVMERQYQALFQTQRGLIFPREIQTNQYGIRFPIVIDDMTIRFEVISEGRIDLGKPDTLPNLPVACLNLTDRIAEKLLANSDRWPDTSVLSRDLIDLAILRLQGKFPTTAIEKAEAAYPVIEPLKRAIAVFQQKPEYRDRCYDLLQVENPSQVTKGLDQLATDLELGKLLWE